MNGTLVDLDDVAAAREARHCMEKGLRKEGVLLILYISYMCYPQIYVLLAYATNFDS